MIKQRPTFDIYSSAVSKEKKWDFTVVFAHKTTRLRGYEV